MALSGLSVTWLGHGTFLLRSPGGRRIVVDPWLDGNPSCPPDLAPIDAADLILVTHGHFDHVHDAAAVAKKTGATVVGIFELCQWLSAKGVEKTSGMNKGGTQELCGIRITMVDAKHSSSYTDDGVITYLGEAAGYVLTFENGLTVYFAGDTSLFGDMRLIHDLYKPDGGVPADRRPLHDGPGGGRQGVRVARRADRDPDALRHVPGADRPARAAARAGGAARCRGARDEARRHEFDGLDTTCSGRR